MNIVSECCHAPVIIGNKPEYPLGGKVWRELYRIELCGKCGKECETVQACEVCGEVNCYGLCEADQLSGIG